MLEDGGKETFAGAISREMENDGRGSKLRVGKETVKLKVFVAIVGLTGNLRPSIQRSKSLKTLGSPVHVHIECS